MTSLPAGPLEPGPVQWLDPKAQELYERLSLLRLETVNRIIAEPITREMVKLHAAFTAPSFIVRADREP